MPVTVVLSSPSRAKQETNSDRQSERRIGSLPERLVYRIDHVIADLAHGMHRFLSFAGRIRHDALHVRARSRPGRVAFRCDDVGDLLGEPPDIIAQRVEIALDIAAGIRNGFAALPGRVLGILYAVANGISDRVLRVSRRAVGTRHALLRGEGHSRYARNRTQAKKFRACGFASATPAI